MSQNELERTDRAGSSGTECMCDLATETRRLLARGKHTIGTVREHPCTVSIIRCDVTHGGPLLHN